MKTSGASKAARGREPGRRPLFPEGQAEAARWSALLPRPACGRAWLGYFAETGSTQDEAFRAASKGAVHGSAFVAEMQTAGRGRRSADWVAPAGSSLLMSVLVRPAPPANLSGRTALAAAVAAATAIESSAPAGKIEIGIKWPNDLLLGGRKLGGLLVESRRGVAVLGLGINVSQTAGDFPPELRERATSLAAAGFAVDRRTLLADILAELGMALEPAGPAPKLWERLRREAERRLVWSGRAVRVTGGPKGTIAGRIAGLADNGALVLETGEGGRLVAATGSLELA